MVANRPFPAECVTLCDWVKMPYAKVLLVQLYVCFLLAIRPCRGDTGWESSLDRLSERDVRVDDPAHMIRNLQDYYKDVFDVKNWSGANSGDSTAQETDSGTVERLVPGRYAVVFRQETSDDVIDRTMSLLRSAHERTNGKITADHFDKLEHAGRGFFATLSENLVSVLNKHPHVEYVEPNVVFRRGALNSAGFMKRSSDSTKIQWDLDRVDEHSRKFDNHYSPAGMGSGVDVYVIDTGINYDHDDFGGRAHYAGLDVIDKLTGSERRGSDCNGHGTHCAGTVGGKTYGIAKDVRLFSLRALDCSGTGSVDGIVIAMDHVIAEHKKEDGKKHKVVSLSLGIKKNKVLNTAIKKGEEAGIVVVSAAGNQGGDSCKYSPASADAGIAVGASDSHDRVPDFSNAGRCVELYAPGYHITSASNECNSCTLTKSGTSMANPHAAGAAAIVLQLYPKATPLEVKKKLIQWSTKDELDLSDLDFDLEAKTHNRLLYVPTAPALAKMEYLENV